MTTQQTTEQTIPARFRVVTDNQDGDVLTTIEGPSAGGVTTFVDNRDGGIVISIDGYNKDELTGLDMTRDEAHRLINDLSAVVCELDMSVTPDVERIARELMQMGMDGTADDMIRMASDAGVHMPAVAARYAEMVAARTVQAGQGDA